MTNEFTSELQNIERRILELKTAGLRPGIVEPYTFPFDSGTNITKKEAPRSYTIYFEDDGNKTAPLVFLDGSPNIYLREYDPDTNSQKIRVDLDYFTPGADLVSSRKILNIVQDSPLPPPAPVQEWRQTVAFNSANMGTTPGWCEQNCRLGFGFAYGVFPTAMADKNSQQANGTLHSGTPPDYLQVPVYCDTGIPEGHVVVWDRGTVWEDGYILPNGLNTYAGHIYGWGELMDGRRVVEHI